MSILDKAAKWLEESNKKGSRVLNHLKILNEPMQPSMLLSRFWWLSNKFDWKPFQHLKTDPDKLSEMQTILLILILHRLEEIDLQLKGNSDER